MPRKDRIDAPGALHHIIIRGIERKAIFKDLKELKSYPYLDELLRKVAGYYRIDPDDLKTAGKESTLTKARTVLCYYAVRKLAISCADVARTLTISPATVSRAASRAVSVPDLKQIQKELLGG
jgi:chromosomal replication initiation ATPase DnaA